MNIDFELIGNRIQSRRKSMSKTQENLAAYLDVSVGYVSVLERGKTKISLTTLAKISDFLSCDIAELITNTSTGGRGYLESELQSTVEMLSPKEKQTLLRLLCAYLGEKA